ncbi:hypothetical protein D915_001052 [Fasciola hepatica]|uniref:Atos-like conserved domain-containing protein n=1 Tax=Fasciola hepatica TaxID=6192 RepID=A0A4E0RXM8_FASHE|nr:hypothetical protein D915_001052 [Fasciola hepatica]
MLQHSEADSNGAPRRTLTYSSKNAIGLIGRFLLTTQIQFLSDLIEYVTVTCRKEGAYEFVYPVEVLPNCIFDRLNSIPENWSTVIETLLLDTALDRRDENRLPVSVLERWVLHFTPTSLSLTQPNTVTIEQAFDEIKRYCVTSPLVRWLKDCGADRARYKLTHRICTTREASPYLGLSFLMAHSELADAVPWHNSESDSYSPVSPATLKQVHNTSSTPPLTCQNPCFLISDQDARSDDDLLGDRTKKTTIPGKTTTINAINSSHTTEFRPIQLDVDHVLHVSVTSPKQFPSTGSHTTSPPFCTVCGVCSKPDVAVATGMRRPARTAFSASASNSSMSSSSSLCTSSASLSSQSDGPYPPEKTLGDNHVDANSSWFNANQTGGQTPSFLYLPSGSSNDYESSYSCTETVRSPMVVMTNVRDSFFPGGCWANPVDASAENTFCENMVPLAPEFDISGSGNSTLTKKSRLVTNGRDGDGSSKPKTATETKSPSPPPLSSPSALQSPDQPILESPPRKQQRMNTADPAKRGTMDKVIDKFTLLNVERNETISSLLVTSLNSAAAAAVVVDPVDPSHPDPSQSAPQSFPPPPNPSNDVVPVASRLDISTTCGPATTDSGLRSSRRRNASSICVSAWPSWSRDSTPFFNRRTGLPLQSSPVPLKRSISGKFDFDASLCPLKLSKSSICMTFGADSRTDPPPVSPLTLFNGSTQAPRTDFNPDPKDHIDKTGHGASATVRSTVTTVATTGSQTTTNISRPRPRPTSLRLHVSPASPAPSAVHPASSSFLSEPLSSNSAIVESNNRNLSGRHRVCPDSHFARQYHPRRNHNHNNAHHNHHQAEMSCSAPPSGNRSFRLFVDRLAKTMAAGTPLSHSSSQHLLVNFEESMLNGRIHPVGQVDGFMVELGASGSFVPDHARLPMQAYFFDLADDNTPSPYLGYADLSHLRHGKGYHLPKKGSVQLTLFNPNKFVVKMFVIGYDFEDMPPNSQTFLRQRTVYMPIDRPTNNDPCKTANLLTGIVHTPQTSQMDEQQHFMNGNKTYGSQLVPPVNTASSQTSMNRRSVPDLFWANRGHGDASAVDFQNTAQNALVGSNLCSHLVESRSTECSFGLSPSCSCSTASSTCSLASGSNEHHSHHHHLLGGGGSSSTSSNSTSRGVELQSQPAFLRYLVHLR